jgi:hypothetical protein
MLARMALVLVMFVCLYGTATVPSTPSVVNSTKASWDESGASVSLSANGKVLAIGAPWNDGNNGTGSGHVRVYAWNSTSAKYTQRGSDIDGEAAYDLSGASVSLSLLMAMF